MHKERININEVCNIDLYGNNSIIQKEKSIIEKLNLTGNEDKDRLIIQQCIDECNLKSDILYNGNTVYPFKKIVKAYRRLQKGDSLENLTNEMYLFFTNVCGDIAHYSLNGYKDYYNYSIRDLENRFLSNYIYDRCSDRNKIFKQLKIGKFFEERENINVDLLSVKDLKTIIKNCGWYVNQNDNIWTLSKETRNGLNYSFEIDVSSNKVSNVINQIQDYYDKFDVDEYIETIVKNRAEQETKPSIRSIVENAGSIKYMLSCLSDDILYKCRIESEILMDFKDKEERTYDLDLELEMG